MNRTSFLVDGFNVYHSLREAGRDLGGKPVKWLDLRSLVTSLLPALGGKAELAGIYYFSALANHLSARKPGVVERHRTYIGCLQAAGVTVQLGRFKKKDTHCAKCATATKHFEEKETDVAISAKLFELLHRDLADTVVLVTGDTDLAPAVRIACDLYPSKQIAFVFPYRRKNKELAKLVPKSILIKKERYAQHQLNDPFLLPSAREIRKPEGW